MRHLKTVLAGFSTLMLSGCIGVAHLAATVPQLEVRGVFKGTEQKTITIAVPHFYGETETFIAMAGNSIDEARFKDITASTTGEFEVTFPEEHRYIGFPVVLIPFAPSGKTQKIRVIFLQVKDREEIFRVFVKGEEAEVNMVRRRELKALPVRRKDAAPRQRSLDEIVEERDFYKTVPWKETKRLSIKEIERGEDKDSIAMEIDISADDDAVTGR